MALMLWLDGMMMMMMMSNSTVEMSASSHSVTHSMASAAQLH
jgi:hypothetical protein